MDERQAYTELYSNFNLEQLQSRLSLIEEVIVQDESKLNTDRLRKQIVQDLITKELDRRTEYYEEAAKQEFPYEYDTMSKNDEERDLQEELYRDKNKEI